MFRPDCTLSFILQSTLSGAGIVIQARIARRAWLVLPVTSGFRLTHGAALLSPVPSDYTRVDGTTFTGAKGGSLVSFRLMISSAECVNIRTLTAIFDHFGEEISVGLVRYVVSVLRRSFDRLSSIFVPPRITRTCGTSSP